MATDVDALKRQYLADIEAVKQKARHAIEILRRETQTAKDEAKVSKDEVEQLKQQLESVHTELDSERKNAQQYEHRISELNESLRSQEGKTSEERDERISDLQSQLAAAREEIARLQAQQIPDTSIPSATQLEEKLRKTEEKLSQLKEAAKVHVTKLQGELAVRLGERNEALALVEQLKSELASARDENSHRQQAGDSSYTQDLTIRLENAESNLKQATQLLEGSENEKRLSQEKVTKLEADMAHLKDAAKRHVENLHRELERSKEAEEQMKKQFEEQTLKMTETYEAQIKTLKDTAASASSAAVSSGRTPPPSDALVRMNRENKELHSKLDAAMKSLNMERDDFRTQSKQARETIERLTTERTQLKRDLDSAKEEARLTLKDLEKTKAELKRFQDQRISLDPTEMQKRKEAEIQVYIDRNLMLESDLRKEQAKCDELQKQIQRLETEVARITGQSLEKSTRLERQLLEAREQISILEEQIAEANTTSSLSDQQLNEFKRKSREQFQALIEQLDQARKQLEQAKQQEEGFRSEIATLRRQTDKSAAAIAAITSQAAPSPTTTPSPQHTETFKMLEEEKAKAESKRKEAMDDLGKAKRDYGLAKREAVSLAEAVDRLRSGLNKAALQAGGNLALAADRCDDALRQCALQIETAVVTLHARESAKQGDLAQITGPGAAEEDMSVMRRRQSSIDSGMEHSGRKDLDPEERLVNALTEAEERLDEMTSMLRSLLPKVKEVVTIAVQDKKNSSLMASFCNLTTVMTKLAPRKLDREEENGHVGSYQGLQMSGQQRSSGMLANVGIRRRRVHNDPMQEPNFDLEEE